LTWNNVDLKGHKLKVVQRADRFNTLDVPKTAAGKREIRFGPVVANTLREWKLACPKGELDLVFPSAKGGFQSNGNIIVRRLIPAQIAARVVKPDGRAKYRHAHPPAFLRLLVHPSRPPT
jgi:integrase